jgi:hypothetical protein
VFVIEGRGVGHFLFRDGPGARDTLRAAGLTVVACREVVTLRLDQEQPGQLGKAARAMADAGVNIEVQYSDHHHRLVLLVDDRVRAEKVARVGPRLEGEARGRLAMTIGWRVGTSSSTRWRPPSDSAIGAAPAPGR